LADPQALIAHGRSEEEVAAAIGADAVVYLPLRDLLECCMKGRRNLDVKRFEVGMFTGEYSSLVSLARLAQSLWPNATIRDILDLDVACEDSAAGLSSTLSMTQNEIAYIGPCTPMQQYLLQCEAGRPGFVNSEFLFRVDMPGNGGVPDIASFCEAWKQTVR
jgi:hypothetical protein